MIFNPFKNLPASQDFHSSPAIRRYEGNPMNVCNCSFSTLWEKLSLESNDIWATALLMLEPAIQQKAAELCLGETLSASRNYKSAPETWGRWDI